MLTGLQDVVFDKRYRSRKWWGFCMISVFCFVLLLKGIDASEFVKWAAIGYPAFCAANAVLKWKGVES